MFLALCDQIEMETTLMLVASLRFIAKHMKARVTTRRNKRLHKKIGSEIEFITGVESDPQPQQKSILINKGEMN